MKWKALAGAVALLAILGILAYLLARGTHSGPVDLEAPGIVEMQEVHLGSKLGGRVAEVRVREGETVSPGQVLVTFEQPEAEAQVEEARAQLRAAQARHAQAVSGPRRAEVEAAGFAAEAARTRLRFLENGPDPADVEQARGSLAVAEARLHEATQRRSRTERLQEGNAVSAEQVDTATALWKQAQGEAAAARARLTQLEAGTRTELIEQARAEVARTESLYHLQADGTPAEVIQEAQALVAAAESRVRQIESRLAESRVRAPDHGMVEVVPVRPGDLVQPNQPVVRFLRAEDLWVKAFVPATHLGRLKLQQPVKVSVDGYEAQPFEGAVTYIADQGEFTPRNVQSVDERAHYVFGIRVRVTDPEGVLKSGMAATVSIPFGAGPE